MKRVEEIGKLKQQHGITVLQLNRWESLLADHMARAEQLGLDGEFVKAVFELIHAQAIKRQLY
jgi:chorismate mutase